MMRMATVMVVTVMAAMAGPAELLAPWIRLSRMTMGAVAAGTEAHAVGTMVVAMAVEAGALAHAVAVGEALLGMAAVVAVAVGVVAVVLAVVAAVGAAVGAAASDAAGVAEAATGVGKLDAGAEVGEDAAVATRLLGSRRLSMGGLVTAALALATPTAWLMASLAAVVAPVAATREGIVRVEASRALARATLPTRDRALGTVGRRRSRGMC